MTRMLVNTKIRLQAIAARRGEDAGQGTLEYIGMVVVAVILIVAVIAAFGEFDFAETVRGRLQELTDSLNG